MKRIFLVVSVSVMMIVLNGCGSAKEHGTDMAESVPVSELDAVGDSSVSESTSQLSYQQISQEEARRLMESETNYIILDVRRQDEFDAGHIPGAILIPNESITDTPPEQLPDLNQMILIYCRSGNRSKQAAEKLAQMGYTNLYEFGGINTWDGTIVTSGEVDGMPTESADGSASGENWKAAYKAVLTDYMQSAEDIDDDMNCPGWDLRDLDDDGTPELLISEGLYHVAGVLFYDYRDGKSQQILQDDGEVLRYGVYGEVMVCPGEHLLGIANLHMGYHYAAMHQYENRRLTLLLSLMENSGAVVDGNVTYTVNDEEVDKAEYDAALLEFNSKDWSLAGRTYSFDDFSVLE